MIHTRLMKEDVVSLKPRTFVYTTLFLALVIALGACSKSEKPSAKSIFFPRRCK